MEYAIHAWNLDVMESVVIACPMVTAGNGNVCHRRVSKYYSLFKIMDVLNFCRVKIKFD
jgi:hypothetical protein